MSVLHETFISNTKFYMMNLIWLAKATDEPTLQKPSLTITNLTKSILQKAFCKKYPCKKYLAKI